MRIVTYHGRPVARIHHLPSGWLRLKLYERLPDGRPRCLQISSDQWVRGRRNEYFDDNVSRSEPTPISDPARVLARQGVSLPPSLIQPGC